MHNSQTIAEVWIHFQIGNIFSTDIDTLKGDFDVVLNFFPSLILVF